MRRFDDLRVAVVGYGSIGRRHAENALRLGVRHLTIVRRASAANPAFAPPGAAVVVHSAATALERGVDLAVICNPTAFHLSAAQAFATAGVPTLIEKPLAADLSQAQDALAWLDHSASHVGVAYCLRYHPAYRLARDVMLAGRLGGLHAAKIWFESYLPEWHPWEDYRLSYAARRELGGGVLPTLDHELDFLAWCLGNPVRVQGRSWRSGKLEMDACDNAQLEMQFAPQLTAHVRLSLSSRDRWRGFEFRGATAQLEFDWSADILTLRDAKGGEYVLWRAEHWDVNAMYLALLRDALEAVRAGRPLPISWRAGLRTLEAIANVTTDAEDVITARNSPVAGVFA